jgi:hypothetical protein
MTFGFQYAWEDEDMYAYTYTYACTHTCTCNVYIFIHMHIHIHTCTHINCTRAYPNTRTCTYIQTADEFEPGKVYVGGIPWAMEKDDLIKDMSRFGAIKEASVVSQPTWISI